MYRVVEKAPIAVELEADPFDPATTGMAISSRAFERFDLLGYVPDQTVWYRAWDAGSFQ